MNKAEILPNFLVFEGLDGAGTTTQASLLEERCAQEGLACFLSREPTDGAVGRLVRAALRREVSLAPQTLAHLFAADRWEHLYGPGGILEALDRGELAVSDRYLFSSLAYQAVESDPQLVRRLNQIFPLPEFLVFLDISPETGENRVSRRGEREIYEYRDFQNRVAANYRQLWQSYASSGMKILSLDGSADPGSIHRQIWSFIRNNR